MSEKPSIDPTPLGRFLDQFSKDLEARVSRTLDEYLELFPGDSEHVAEEFLALKRFREQGEHAPSGAIPTQISHYRIIKELGRGGQGVVYLAKDMKLGREVAIKMLRRSRLALEELERLQREARIASRLDHPGICPIYDIGDYGGEPYIVMRYVRGTSLSHRLDQLRKTSATTFSFVDVLDTDVAAGKAETPDKHEKPRERETDAPTPSGKEVHTVLRLIEQVARALHEAHEAEIIHRDVKPGNIIVTPEGQPVIVDFGVATMLKDGGIAVTRTGETPGTPPYMSPEQTSGKRTHLDRRTDVYSLGVTLYECLTLRLPFSDTADFARQIMFVPPPDPRAFNSAISKDLRIVIDTALEKDRNRRYATAADLADDLRRVRDREPIKARPIGIRVRFTRWVQRNPALAASIISVIVILTAALIIVGAALHDASEARETESNQRETLERARSLYEPLADLKRLEELGTWSSRLWPVRPEQVPGHDGMDGWLAEAGELLQRKKMHEEFLGTIESGGAVMSQADRQRRGRFLKELITELESLPIHVGEMERRRGSALSIEARTIEEHRAEWAAIAAELSRDQRFDPISPLKPQVGLIPLGKNEAGLYEFALADSGESRPRSAASKPVAVDELSAAVLVLLPGGTLEFDPTPGDFSSPPSKDRLISVSITPFFLGVHEITQAHWKRLMLSNPSAVQVGRYKVPLNERHPVENMTWTQATEFCRLLGVRLPTQDEWEYGARSTRGLEFGDSDHAEDLEGCENVADVTYVEVNRQRPQSLVDWRDGYGFHAPVGTFRSNGFGLYDMLGNVAEHCSDRYLSPRRASGDTRPVVSEPGEPSTPPRVYRGGSWQDGPRHANCRAFRYNDPESIQPRIGVRIARSVDR